jgi:plasmid stabilization system protein ParE
MGLTLRFDDRALDNLRQIKSYIAERSPSGAERVRRHIMHTIDSLADFPFLGRATDETHVRILVMTKYPYLVFYSVVKDEVVILHIRHAARDPIDPASL